MDEDLEEFKAFEDFWRSDPEAAKLPGVDNLIRRPYLSMAHDAMWALVLAAHK